MSIHANFLRGLLNVAKGEKLTLFLQGGHIVKGKFEQLDYDGSSVNALAVWLYDGPERTPATSTDVSAYHIVAWRRGWNGPAPSERSIEVAVRVPSTRPTRRPRPRRAR